MSESGRLYDVDAWNPLWEVAGRPGALAGTPLSVALATGFHGLMGLLLQHEPRQRLTMRKLAARIEYTPTAISTSFSREWRTAAARRASGGRPRDRADPALRAAFKTFGPADALS